MFTTLKNAWKVAELRQKMLFTVIILVLFRLGSVIPVPYFDSGILQATFQSAEGSVFQYLNILSGEAFARGTLFALSVSPYITAQIIMQLLTIAIPALERIAKEGETGRRKIETWTRYFTVVLAVVTAYGYYAWLRSIDGVLTDRGFFAGLVIVATYTAGAALVMWLAEKINEHGIGNGISMILFANIVAGLPSMILGIVLNPESLIFKIVAAVLTAVFVIAIVAFVVFVTESERRIPVQYAKKVVGRKMYGGQSSSLPIKLNMSGVMPIIFAQSIVSIPATLQLIFRPEAGTVWYKIFNAIGYTSPIYAIVLFILIIAFAYFYLAISFNPVEVANNIKNNGGVVLGIRPGKPTADYIAKILSRVTLIGAIFLGLIAILPMVLAMVVPSLGNISFGGTSLLIGVGVALEFVREIESQLMMRNYKGFLD